MAPMIAKLAMRRSTDEEQNQSYLPEKGLESPMGLIPPCAHGMLLYTGSEIKNGGNGVGRRR